MSSSEGVKGSGSGIERGSGPGVGVVLFEGIGVVASGVLAVEASTRARFQPRFMERTPAALVVWRRVERVPGPKDQVLHWVVVV